MALDFYFDEGVKLLLPCTGSNNSTVVTDLSPSPAQIALSGNAKISTDVNDPFGQNSGVLRLSSSGWATATADKLAFGYIPTITFEAWIYITSSSVYNMIIDTRDYGSSKNGIIFLVGLSKELVFVQQNGVTVASPINLINLNEWTYVAFRMVPPSNKCEIFYKKPSGSGMFTSSITLDVNQPFSKSSLLIGRGVDNVSLFSGYISNIRLTAKKREIDFSASEPFPARNARVPITISEGLAASSFKVYANDVFSGIKCGFTKTTSGSVNIPITEPSKGVILTVAPDVGNMWVASTSYAVGDLVYPSNPSSVPYYYARQVAGSSGSTEPTWPTNAPGALCNDGAVSNAWAMVERIAAPVANYPLFPE